MLFYNHKLIHFFKNTLQNLPEIHDPCKNLALCIFNTEAWLTNYILKYAAKFLARSPEGYTLVLRITDMKIPRNVKVCLRYESADHCRESDP